MPRQTLATLSEDYLAMRSRQRFSAQTLRCERSSIMKLCRWWDRTRRAPSSLDDHAMEDFLFGADGLADKVHYGTFNTQLSQIRKFVEWLIRRKIVAPTVLDVMKSLTPQQREFLRLSLQDLVRMVDGVEDPYERFVLAFGFQTLGREGEMMTRLWRHVDLENGSIEWYRNKVSKTANANDHLPITMDLDRELRRWVLAYQEVMGEEIQADWHLIPHREGSGLRGWRYMPHQRRVRLGAIVQKHVQPYAPSVDLKGQGSHILRRSAARALYEQLLASGEPDPARIVQAMLGHASVVTTERYLGIRKDREKRDAALRGASLLSVPTDNVVELKAV